MRWHQHFLEALLFNYGDNSVHEDAIAIKIIIISAAIVIITIVMIMVIIMTRKMNDISKR